MKTRFLITTALGLVFATAAFAQSPNSTTTSPGTSQTQAPTTSTTPQTPSASTTSPGASTSAPQAQSTAPASSAATSQSSTGSSQPTQAQTGTQTPPASSQAQQAPSTDQAQRAPAGGTPNTAAQQPAQPSTATNNTQPSTNVNAAVNINAQQRTRVAESITRLNVQPLNNVNFSLTVGTAVPRDVRLQTLPSEVVEVVPQYRGYSFFVVRDEIVIVEPSTYQIVTVLPRGGGSTAAAPARSKVAFTDKDRDVVRKHVKTRTTERQTTGSTAKVVIRRDERLPDTVEFEEFPETVYRDAPSLREYRYIHRENRTYLVDPGERRVIEEID
jgi:DNA mismatch repair ATPase MutL